LFEAELFEAELFEAELFEAEAWEAAARRAIGIEVHPDSAHHRQRAAGSAIGTMGMCQEKRSEASAKPTVGGS
jgi:hypothetical protein